MGRQTSIQRCGDAIVGLEVICTSSSKNVPVTLSALHAHFDKNDVLVDLKMVEILLVPHIDYMSGNRLTYTLPENILADGGEIVFGPDSSLPVITLSTELDENFCYTIKCLQHHKFFYVKWPQWGSHLTEEL